MTHKRDVGKKSWNRKSGRSEHVQREHASSDGAACAGWADAINMLQELLTTQLATVSEGCARSLLEPCSTNFIRSSLVFLSQNVRCIQLASNTERGIACDASTRAQPS